MPTLGIETSCDETAVAVTSGKKVLSSVVSSSVHLHSRYGGVVPEIASRYHVEFIGHCLTTAMKNSKLNFKDIDLISVTQGPGLMGSLLVGVSMAKALSFALDKPIIGVNHILAHIWSVFLNSDKKIKFPFIGLVVSGGHTSIFYVKSATDMKVMGQTRDDACGESFDKVAKVLKLGYPGGPVIENRATKGNAKKIRFPRSYLGDSLDFSFSGVKTSVLYYVKGAEKKQKRLSPAHINDIAASFQESVFDVVARKAISACRMKNCNSLLVGGGVSINKRLRQKLFDEAKPSRIKIHFPPKEFCLDNGAMIAHLGEELFKKGISSKLDFSAFQHS